MSDEREKEEPEAPTSSDERASEPPASRPSEPPADEGKKSAPPKSGPVLKVAADSPATPHPKPSYGFLAITSIIALAADLGSKAWAVARLDGAHREHITVADDFWLPAGYRGSFHIDLAHNKGGAWGIFGEQPDYVRLPFFFLISAIAVVFVVSLYKRLEPRQTALKWALPLLLGGAAGNLADRIRHQYVVDFLDVFVTAAGKQTHWPTFNVADVWIVVGVGLMAIDMFTPRKAVPVKARAEKDSEEAEAEA